MANFELIMPKLGESIIEATIIKWHKKEGDHVTEDETIADLATDKVDSEIPSPVEGTITKLFFSEGDVVPVGKVIAIIDLGGSSENTAKNESKTPTHEEIPDSDNTVKESNDTNSGTNAVNATEQDQSNNNIQEEQLKNSSDKFYSPLVRNMAKAENISLSELDKVKGTGKDERLTKDDFKKYLETRKSQPTATPQQESKGQQHTPPKQAGEMPKITPPTVATEQGDTIVEMDRMRKLIADHMVMSKHVSPHVTSFIEVDLTNIVKWREKVKDGFQKKEGEKITYTPIFVQASAIALREMPNVNASVDGYNVIQRKAINIGMAAALPSGNLIVPVIKNADQKNLLGLTKDVNNLASRARANKLNPDDIVGGTFTITNFGAFESLTGSPVINQPQVAILGVGTIKKRPWVMEVNGEDVIAIRHICMLSLSYDHRIVDGALGGQFLKRVRDILESFDTTQTI